MMIAAVNPGEQGEGAPEYGWRFLLVDAERDTHDRVVFRTRDHGPDDEDL
jgi:hypothetical protein